MKECSLCGDDKDDCPACFGMGKIFDSGEFITIKEAKILVKYRKDIQQKYFGEDEWRTASYPIPFNNSSIEWDFRISPKITEYRLDYKIETLEEAIERISEYDSDYRRDPLVFGGAFREAVDWVLSLNSIQLESLQKERNMESIGQD